MLSLDSKSPEVTETSVVAHLLHSLEIFSESGVDHVGDQLSPRSILDAPLSVQHPLGDAVIEGLGQDVGDLVHFFFGDLSGSLVGVDLGNLEDKTREVSSDTFDDSKSELDLVLTVHVGVLHSQNVLEIVSFLQYQSSLHVKISETVGEDVFHRGGGLSPTRGMPGVQTSDLPYFSFG